MRLGACCKNILRSQSVTCFFFQAEDGIRDSSVTGVQTCALPILLHRLGEAVIEGIGGCNLGSRNLDFHYRGFARLGATVTEGESMIHIQAGQLRGAHLYLDTPSHTGTENLIMAASLAPGRTVIDNTALEPEVLDVIAFLTKMGARIGGGGTGFVTVEGVDELSAAEHTVMPDRIHAGGFRMAAGLPG